MTPDMRSPRAFERGSGEMRMDTGMRMNNEGSD
jgi:hypothetical protein